MGKDLFNDRISRFSIRKLNVGVCSVLLGTLVMVGTAATAAADEQSDSKSDSAAAVTTAPESSATSTATATSVASTAPASSTYDANAAITAPATSTVPATSTAAASTSAASSTSTAASAASTAPATSTAVATPSLEAARPENKAVEATATSTDKGTQLAAGVPASSETPAVTPETSGKRRSRRSVGDPNDPNLIGDDVEDATSTPKVDKPGFTTNIKATDLASQISWLDFGDTANWTGTTTTSKGELALQVGATYTKEIMPGYVVTIKVKSLKPFQATELYKKRLEERGATAAEKATYDPNARNGYVNATNTPATRAAFAAGEEAKVIAEAQNRWTEIKKEGIDTGTTKKTTISSEFEGGNIGVQFEVSATFRGKVVKPAIVMADGESANPGEMVLFTTNGEGWQHIGEWYKYGNKSTKTFIPQDTDNLFGPNPANNINGISYYRTNLDLLRRSNQVGPDKKEVAWKYFGSADLTTGGLGTGVFGPNISSIAAVPLVMTRGASEVGLYIASSGKQSAMFGFFPLDEGDAPASYGKAIHSIATVDGVTGKKVNQPYLGHLIPDMDENNALDWFGDDKATTADEGVDQLLPADLKGTTNEMIKMDRTKPGNYTISVEAHTDGAPQANIYGWIDFNQNGTFDEDERSDLATITKDGTVELHFTKSKTYIDPSVNELGVRVRIAKDAAQIESPTGMAFSGEVEDFRTQVTHPPKGEVKETTGPQFEKQTATVAFTARGLYKYSRTENAKIDETVAPQMVDNRTGQVVTPGADGYYAVAGQGKYKITPNGTSVDVEFIPEDHFLGTADGISIRRTDTNGYDTGWSTKFPDMEANVDTAIHTMDGLYIPTVTPKDIEGENKTSTDVQGATQTGTPTFNVVGTNLDGNKVTITPSALYPAKLVDPATGQPTNALSVTVAGEGTYTIDDTTGQVTFVPEPGFTGTANGVTVSLSAPVGRDKDGTIRDEYVKTATAKYTPTVTPITVTPTNKVSEDIQNVPQTQTPTFDLSNDKTAQITSKKLVDPATGQPTDATTVTISGEGSYTIDPTTGAVTFTPEKDFVGTATGVTVQATATITNANGKTATITSDATYTPTVVAAKPTAQPATSKDIQGATQTGTPTFAGTTVQVNGQNKPVTIKANSYKLLDKDGNEVTGTTPAYAADGTTVIGNFSIDTATGQVTFTPTDKSYTGAVTPVKVQAESSNGIKVDTTYTPEIVPVTPTATPAETTDIQGATQTSKPEFQGGTVNVDGVEKTVAINEAVPATFDDGTKTKTVPNVGTYTVAADGTVTFVPEKSFIGTAPAVTVVREDMNGTKAQATYTPTVTPVKPTGTPVTSTDIQGATQTGKPVFTEGDSRVPMDDTVPATFEDGSTTKTVDGVGTYTVAPDGTVTFKPLPTYVGTPEGVTVKRVDKNGTPATAKYTPTVTPVVPTAVDATSKDKQGQTQTGKPVFTAGTPSVPMDDTVPATFEDGSTTKTVPGEGTYTVAPDGTVTFVPEKSFTGVGTGVTVKRVDKNGTPATAKYTPTVTPVTPTATPATSEAPQGVVQTGTVTFTEGDPVAPIDKDTITLLDENGQPAASVVAKSPEGKEIGTYTVDKTTGVVTFTPTDKSYSGEVVPVKVQAKDTNGTPAETTYTPKITPVVPTAEPATSTDIQGKTQTGKPTFTEGNPSVPMDDTVPATFEDGSTTKTIPGEGTYTVAPDGTVTFVPEKSFTGTGTGVTVKRVDKNGTPATAKYTPTVTPVVPTAEPATSTDKQGQTQTGTPAFTAGNPNVPMDDTVPATFEDGSTTKTIPGEGTYTVAPDGTVTFVPEKSFTGTGTGVTVKRVDKNGTPATAKYTPTVTPVTPTATPATSEAPQGVVQTGTVTFTEGDPVAPIDKDTITLLDENGQPAASVVAKSPEGKEIGTYTVDKTTGVVTFTPTDKSYSGEVVPVKVQAKDTNGTPAETTYTPKITPVVPTAEPATSTDIQGKTQTGKPTFTPGNPSIPMDDDVPATFEDGSTTKTIPGEGTYTVAPDGTVTFVPEKSFTGVGTGVTVKRVDKNGTPATAKYTPTVTPVVPTAEPATSTDIQGKTQTGTPSFTPGNPAIPMDDDVPATFEDGSTTKTIPGEGTYTVAPDGTVTFVPEKSFTGTGTGVTVKRVDKNGTPVTAKYTPTVTPVVPTAEPATSTDIQGATQTGKPKFTEGDSRVPMNDDVPATFDDGSTTKTVDGVGTYTVAADGTVTFVPEKSFVGTAPAVTVVREDKNGTKASATYTPTVTPVTPTGTPAVSTDVQGATQTGKPSFTEGDSRVPLNDTVPATFDDGTTIKTVPNVGTYTVAPDGTVTFVPEKSFVGTAPAVTVVREDVNGTKAQATYTPTVTPVTPTADPVASTDIQGQTQTGKPNFTPGHPSVPMDDDVPATFEDGSTTKTIPGEGTYTVAPDGTVTFVPEKSFTGKGTGVTVKRVDKNGTPVTATYTPTVTPVAPTAEPVTSIGNKGQTQTGKPVFTEGDSRVPMNDQVPATFDDGSTTKTIPGVGTYTVAPDGTVTFTPEPEFTGTAPAVTVVREDVNGTKAQATYTPTVRPITKFVDKEGKEIPGYPTVDGEEPKAKIPGYRFVETKKLPNGDTEHVYEKVTTSHVDENGKPIPGYPTEDGEQPKKDIPGYDFVKTVVDKDGNIQHIYKKTVTPSPMPTPTPQPQPKPEEPTVPVVPEAKEEVTYIDPQDPSAQLPNTGTKESSNTGLAIFSALAGLSLFGLAKRKKED
ncbi:CshA/CshB family fibrillar adhesin-related protein [Streptococcus sp.]|uniref:CshA/CshB family fibrillar adhesin-related protein n=1 Tax=Streptococcus sp. TaxID=1306 RepID=UPI003994E664